MRFTLMFVCGFLLACGGGGEDSPKFLTDGADDPGPLSRRASRQEVDACASGCETVARCGLTSVSQCITACEASAAARACVSCIAARSCSGFLACESVCTQ